MKRAALFAAVILVTALGWLIALPAAPARQILPFNHARHSEIACVACHRGAESATRAGVPEFKTCTKCHTTAPAAVRQTALWDDAARGGSPGWIRVTRVADHVMFSHRRHVALGRLACQSCHGDVPRSSTLPGVSPVRLDMSACVTCHKQAGASEDCAACHR